jgi:hypothetical protein
MRLRYLLLILFVILLTGCERYDEEHILTYDTIFGSRADYIENADYVTIIHVDSNKGESDETLFDGVLPLTKLEVTVVYDLYGKYLDSFVYHMGGFDSTGDFIARKKCDIYKDSKPNIIAEGFYVVASFDWGVEYPAIELAEALPGYDIDKNRDNQSEEIEEILSEFRRTYDEKYAERLSYVRRIGDQIAAEIDRVRNNPDGDYQCELITLAIISSENCETLLNIKSIVQNSYENQYSLLYAYPEKLEYELNIWLITFYIVSEEERGPVLDYQAKFDGENWELSYVDLVRVE